jgi:xanthine dehydrogenase accessory factor
MLDLLGPLASCLLDETNPQPCAVATLIGTAGSAPRTVGTSMLVTQAGEVSGSLSGGCVEGAVFETCQEAIASGMPSREHYGLTDDDVFAVGLPCGGTLEVLVQPYYPSGKTQGLDVASFAATALAPSAALVRRIDNDEVSAMALSDPLGFEPERIWAGLLAMVGEESVARSAAAQVGALVRAGRTGLVRLVPGKTDCAENPIELLVETRLEAPRLLMFGANDFSAALGNAAALLGFRVTLCDSRAVFTTQGAFPQVDELVIERPDRYLARIAAAEALDQRSAICVLTHDEKFDIPVLETALQLEVGYVGAMGSRRSHDRRVQSLRERGLNSLQLARLHSPIGLNIGAVTPEEVAVSIVSEIVAERRGRSSTDSLSRSDEPIHGESVASLAQSGPLLR